MKTIPKIVALAFGLSLAGLTYAANLRDSSETLAPGVNPIFRDAFTADPAPLVVGDTLYVYTGSDIPDETGKNRLIMPAWRLYSTKDMIQRLLSSVMTASSPATMRYVKTTYAW